MYIFKFLLYKPLKRKGIHIERKWGYLGTLSTPSSALPTYTVKEGFRINFKVYLSKFKKLPKRNISNVCKYVFILK